MEARNCASCSGALFISSCPCRLAVSACHHSCPSAWPFSQVPWGPCWKGLACHHLRNRLEGREDRRLACLQAYRRPSPSSCQGHPSCPCRRTCPSCASCPPSDDAS